MDIPLYEDFLKQLKYNLWVTGIPYGSQKFYFRFFVYFVTMSLMVIEEGSFFVSRISDENLVELTHLAPCTCTGILSMLKVVAVAQKRSKIFNLSESLSKLYEKILKEESKVNIVKKDLNAVNSLMKYFFVLNVVLITVYNFSTLIISLYQYFATGVWEFALPYAVLLPFSTNAWVPWACVYIQSIICGFICILYYTTADGLYFVLTSHVCANFAVISDTIQQLDKTNVYMLKDIIRDHQYILALGEDLEDIFMLPNLFNVLIGSIQICALGFNLTTGSWEQIPGCILFLLSVLLQILMMSVFGENIVRESTKIGDAAFLCKWNEMDHVAKKTLLTIMIRSQKPLRLTAYKFSAITYGSFTKIISTSWSYFTILRTVYTPAKAIYSRMSPNSEPECD